MKLKAIVVSALFCVGVASCGQETATQQAATEASAPPIQDIAAERPDAVKVVFQNDYVRVLRFDLDPNTALPPHLGGRRVVYSLTDYEVNWTEGGNDLGPRSWKTGEAHAHEADVHAIENIGETIASFVVFERLESPLTSAPMHEAGSDLPAGARSLLSNGDFHVLEITLQPGDSQEMHHGGWRAVYSLSDYTIEWREGESVEQKSWSAGDAHWHEPGEHAARNTGATEARWVVVGLRN